MGIELNDRIRGGVMVRVITRMCLCKFLGVELICYDGCNNVNKDHDKVKELIMTEEKCSGGDESVITQPVALQRSRKSKSKSSKNKRQVVHICGL